MNIHKSHSKTDLIDLINYLGLPIVFNHSNNKKELHEKMHTCIESSDRGAFLPENHFGIDTMGHLSIYLRKANPKKTLSIKEKSDVMTICKGLIVYCNGNYDLNLSPQYSDTQSILDDALYIKNFGDIPSVRRACRLLKGDPKFVGQHFDPIISPQVMKTLDEKASLKKPGPRYSFIRKDIVITFD
tara:strand:+ start:467 stop:1024 length:558 start_codon:yes stop_codon:yes gene_type:complete